MSREERLARTLVELADTLVDDFDVIELLALLVERSVELLDASAAGLVLADEDGVLQHMVSTSEATELVERFQVQHGRKLTQRSRAAEELRRFSAALLLCVRPFDGVFGIRRDTRHPSNDLFVGTKGT